MSAPAYPTAAWPNSRDRMEHMVKRFKYMRCQVCGLEYQPVDWLPWRADGYCSQACAYPDSANNQAEPIQREAEIWAMQGSLELTEP